MFPVEFFNLFQPVIEFSELVRAGYGAQLFLSQTGTEKFVGGVNKVLAKRLQITEREKNTLTHPCRRMHL